VKKLCLLLAACCLAAPAAAELRVFEDVRPGVAEPLADAQAVRFSTLFTAAGGGGRLFNLGLGSGVGLLQPADRAWSLEGRAAVFSRFDFRSPSFDFKTADFIGGLAWRGAAPWGEAEVFGYHHSGHLGDLAGGEAAPNVSREVLRVLGWWRAERFAVYLGPRLILHADPDWQQGKAGVQGGAQWQLGRFSLALDLKLRGEYRGDTDVAFTAGMSLSPPAARFQQVVQVFGRCGRPGPGQLESGYENLAGLGLVLVDQGPAPGGLRP
jgi:hypothetical protein